ncbi:hypothetical protein SAMN04488062_1342 [Flavobacterium omnivorum]|jgi:hypothetical protein|uniref:Uncharacterized protein n=1 Tax=Flavobacterium omnivorum TaxID=178355 RepID=A0A1G8J864_9FLAO|nr:hypothetical protein SAMN04488062_1342 [Flavobacterium omnivorum]
MIKIRDYIFYRTYEAYKKKEHPALFSSTLYLSACDLFLFSFSYGICIYLLDGIEKKYKYYIFLLYFSIVVFLNINKYYKKQKIKDLISLYQNNYLNKTISSWVFFFILPICMVVGIGFHILISIIIKKYNLEGWLFFYFSNI